MSIFYQFGDISSVRILRPSKDIPHDLRDVLGKMAETMTGISAVVEFETAEAASGAFTRFTMKNDVVIEGQSFEINCNLLGLESNGLGDDDSGCGESGSSGDEGSNGSSHDLNYLINEDSNNLEEDYEKYMNEIRKERQTENKTNVPEVIAALMDEYGSGSTVPCTSATLISSPSAIRRPSPFEPFSVIGPIRSSCPWSTNWSHQETEEETDTQLQELLAGSSLSSFGNMKIDDDDVFTNDSDANLMAPTLCQSSPPASVHIKGWADAVRQ